MNECIFHLHFWQVGKWFPEESQGGHSLVGEDGDLHVHLYKSVGVSV